MLKHTLLLSLVLFSSTASADDLKIISWNMSPSFYEGIPNRTDDVRRLSEELDADVLILIEVTGNLEAQQIAQSLGWDQYYGIVSNQAIAKTSAFQALETAVISKVPILRVIEHDTFTDGHHEVFTEKGIEKGRVREQRLSAEGIKGFGQPLAQYDRGTLQVDLEGDLSIFTAHLKSNRNNECFDLSDAINFFKKQGIGYDSSADKALKVGFSASTLRRKSNAEKRERVMAATARQAAITVRDGRTTLIAGDFNTAFETGKYGREIEDCLLQDFSCEKAPFPSTACTGADGFDDTLGMLEAGLIAGQHWEFLSKQFPRTYRDKNFADAAIDHFAVDENSFAKFSNSFVANKLYGSDHYPIVTTYTY